MYENALKCNNERGEPRVARSRFEPAEFQRRFRVDKRLVHVIFRSRPFPYLRHYGAHDNAWQCELFINIQYTAARSSVRTQSCGVEGKTANGNAACKIQRAGWSMKLLSATITRIYGASSPVDANYFRAWNQPLFRRLPFARADVNYGPFTPYQLFHDGNDKHARSGCCVVKREREREQELGSTNNNTTQRIALQRTAEIGRGYNSTNRIVCIRSCAKITIHDLFCNVHSEKKMFKKSLLNVQNVPSLVLILFIKTINFSRYLLAKLWQNVMRQRDLENNRGHNRTQVTYAILWINITPRDRSQLLLKQCLRIIISGIIS